MEIDNSKKNKKKFNQFVGESKDSFFRRIRYELKEKGLANYNLKEKKDFELSELDVDVIYKEWGTVPAKIKKIFELSEDDFEDIFQESIIALHKNIGTNIGCTLSTYFYSICYNQTLKFLRNKNKSVNIDFSDPTFDEKKKSVISSKKLNQIIQTIPTRSIFPQQDPTPDKAFDLSLMKELVHNALDDMAGKCRQILTKFYIEGYNWSEIAVDYELKDALSAKSTAERCKKRFREKHQSLRNFVNKK